MNRSNRRAEFNEEYIEELLADIMKRPPVSREDFRQRCVADLNAGYRVEVDEAERRYFGQGDEA